MTIYNQWMYRQRLRVQAKANEELDIALERSANARGVERDVVWWRAAMLPKGRSK